VLVVEYLSEEKVLRKEAAEREEGKKKDSLALRYHIFKFHIYPRRYQRPSSETEFYIE
jgi:hypothetical protein